MRRTLVPRTPRLPESLWDLRREMEGLFNQAYGEEGAGGWLAGFVPEIDVAETDNAYEIKAELPGMKPEDIEVELHGDVLTIAGERKEEEETKNKKLHRTERRYGAFRRTITLPEAGDAAKVTAEYEDGILAVAVPKTPENRPKKVKVAGKA